MGSGPQPAQERQALAQGPTTCLRARHRQQQQAVEGAGCTLGKPLGTSAQGDKSFLFQTDVVNAGTTHVKPPVG